MKASPSEPRTSTEQMTRIILSGSYLVNIVLAIVLWTSFIILKYHVLMAWGSISLGSLAYLILVSLFVCNKHAQIAAWMLVGLHAFFGSLILYSWGVNAPFGVLMLGYTIFLTSVTAGHKPIVYVTLGAISILVLIQYMGENGYIHPYSSGFHTSSYVNVISYSVIFGIFALIAWLSSKKTADVLKRAVDAEYALQKERDALTVRVEEQMTSLRDAQQKELKQLYEFAELGQLTTIILHELANYLTILTLDIDDIEDRHQNSVAINHAKESIFYIDALIDQGRNQIKNSDNSHIFNALLTTKESIDQLQKKLVNLNVKLLVKNDHSSRHFVYGDPLRLFQAITILVTNAVQAKVSDQAEITVIVSSTKSDVLISVKDYGRGIPQNTRETLFTPQKSTKTEGLGIGLYITKQIIETHFKGTIWLSPSAEYTQFNIKIPKAK